MGRHDLWETVPVVVAHLVAAGSNMAAAAALGAGFSTLFSAGVATFTLAAPTVGLAFTVSGLRRPGVALHLLGYLGTSALGAYANLGLGLLSLALGSPAGNAWRFVFFATAVLLPLLQAWGIWQSIFVLIPEGETDEERA